LVKKLVCIYDLGDEAFLSSGVDITFTFKREFIESYDIKQFMVDFSVYKPMIKK
jgi:hypothetical protein